MQRSSNFSKYLFQKLPNYLRGSLPKNVRGRLDLYIAEEKACAHKARTIGCINCPKVSGCMSHRAVLRPIPWYFWVGVSMVLPLPLYYALYPEERMRAMNLMVERGNEIPEERKKWYIDILNKVGIKKANEAIILESSDVHSPTALGGRDHPIILMPRTMVLLTDPDHEITLSFMNEQDGMDEEGFPERSEEITVWHGKAGKIDDRMRRHWLEKEAILLPKREEIEYVVGHEAGHLLNNDNSFKAVAGLSTLFFSHLSIKIWNRVMDQSKKTRRLRVLNKGSHSLIVTTFGLIAYTFLGWFTEARADITSATRLHLEEEALELTKKKIRQNQVLREQGDKQYTAHGNDLLDFEHPPLSIQKKYLEKLVEEKNLREKKD